MLWVWLFQKEAGDDLISEMICVETDILLL